MHRLWVTQSVGPPKKHHHVIKVIFFSRLSTTIKDSVFTSIESKNRSGTDYENVNQTRKFRRNFEFCWTCAFWAPQEFLRSWLQWRRHWLRGTAQQNWLQITGSSTCWSHSSKLKMMCWSFFQWITFFLSFF